MLTKTKGTPSSDNKLRGVDDIFANFEGQAHCSDTLLESDFVPQPDKEKMSLHINFALLECTDSY